MSGRWALYEAGTTGILLLLLIVVFGPHRNPDFWLTPDQQGDRLLREHKFEAASKVYTDPARRGVAFYQGGDFKSAAAAFSQSAQPEAVFNHGNALMMLGKYDDAVKAYDRALTLRPDWKAAEENRAIAVVRRDHLKMTGGDEVGGQLKPDSVVYEKGAKKSGETVQVDAGPPKNDQELQALWLRHVQTKPADFLRSKFAFQAARQSTEGKP